MAHAKRFRDDDPFLPRVRELALALPGAQQKVSHGCPAFFTKKVFCVYGGSQRIDGVWTNFEESIVVLPAPDDREGLLADPRCYPPAYFAPSGWIGWHLDDDTEWDEVAELLHESWRLTAPARLVREMDARHAG